MADGRDVTLRLKAEDKTGPALAQAKAALDKFGAATRKAVVTRDSYKKAAAEVRQLEAAFNRASADASRYAQAMDKAARAESLTAAEARELRDAFTVARQRMRDLNTEVRAAKTNLDSLGGSTAGVRSSFARISAGWTATAESAREAAREARRAAAAQVTAARRTADAQGRAAVQAIRANRARKASFLSLFGVFRGGSYNRAGAFLRGEAAAGTAKGRGILGLRPFELTNLSYQINDVVTGLASGQKPLQVLAQQGGQVFQLFQGKLLPIIGRFGPALAGAAIAGTPLVAALRRISTESDNLATFNSQIERAGSGAAYSAPSLVALAKELSRTGLSAEEARGAIRAFIDAGIAEDQFRQMALASKTLADALGIDVADAAKQLATAMRSGFDAVLEFEGLMKQVPTSVLSTAIAMAEAGDEAGALIFILGEVAGTGGDLSDEAAGPWTEAFQSVANAWNQFVDALANSSTIQGAINLVSTLSGVVAGLVGGLANLITKLGGVAGALQADNGLLGQAVGIGKNAVQAAIPGSGVLSRFAPGSTFGPDKPAEAEIIGDNPNGDIFDPTAGGTAANADLIDGYNQRQDALEELAEAEQEAADEASKAILDRIEAQQDFNAELAETIDQNEFAISQIGRSAGEQAYRTAVREAETQAKRDGVEVDKAALEVIGESARKLAETTEAEKARNKAAGGGAKKQKEVNTELERRKVLEKEVADLTRLRSELETGIAAADDDGDTEAATALRDRMAEVNTELTAAIDNMIAFWTATGGAEAEAAILKLERLKTEVARTGQESVTTGKAMNDFIAGGGVGAFDKFSKAVVETGNEFESAKVAFLEFASDFLREIARMILRQALLNALGGGAGGSGGGGFVSGLVNGLFRHQGGLVGSGGGMRPVPITAFAGAERFHSGGLPGLKPGEVGAILQKGEEVLTADDPRHVGNGGGQGGGNTRIINAIDGASFLEEAMRDRRGETAILNFIKANPSAVRGALGV